MTCSEYRNWQIQHWWPVIVTERLRIKSSTWDRCKGLEMLGRTFCCLQHPPDRPNRPYTNKTELNCIETVGNQFENLWTYRQKRCRCIRSKAAALTRLHRSFLTKVRLVWLPVQFSSSGSHVLLHPPPTQQCIRLSRSWLGTFVRSRQRCPREAICFLIRSMSRRIGESIHAHGGYTRYWPPYKGPILDLDIKVFDLGSLIQVP